ncbi:sialic acid-binding Ig-like lectin 10 [Hippoglossus stenolepis]|uniref:sialic acid-binding Ig-like lectin 10 n=1 Tax=Hippoglossus stenolepis TaxID=195615 RepID=UPI001FAEA1C3|nr:sialic acid-binding Ig-like lectin 10 [Hippoglossus stenolepis]XP_047196713.1 sialic acid-binding Ig-like lectin 10 [Hippoglossus stenolepis]
MNFHQIRMFVLIWATLLFSVRVSDAETGSSVLGEPGCPLKDYCNTLVEGEITAEAGLCVVIPCSFTVPAGIQVSHIVWFKCEPTKDRCGDGDMIFHTNTDSDKVQSEFKGRVSLLESDVSQKNCSIIVNDLKESDSGAYQLRVNTVPRGGSYTFPKITAVSVKGLSQRPTLMIPPLTEGQLTTLTCTAPGLCSGSEPTFTWRWRGRGESDAYLTGSITTFKTENVAAFAKRSSSTLSFSPSAEHHGTNITCTVIFKENVSTEETATLNVTYYKEVRTTQNANVSEGKTLNLTCSVEGFPPSLITWTKVFDQSSRNGTGTTLQNTTFSDLLYHTEGRGTATLSIFNVTAEDSGQYICTVTHMNRTWKKNVNVTVIYMRDPVITGDLIVKEGDVLNLTCRGNSFPPSVVAWTEFDSSTNPPNGTDLKNDSVSSTLIIPNVTAEHSGHYICTAQHLNRTATTTADVTVTWFSKILKSSDCVVQSGVLTCVCISEGFPLPTIKWLLLEDQTVYSVITTVSNYTVNSTVIVKGRNDSSVQCVSSNANGEAKEKFTTRIQPTELSDQPAELFKRWWGTIIAFLIGFLLSAVVFCLAKRCHRKKQKSSGNRYETVDMVTNHEDPLIHNGQAAKDAQTRGRKRAGAGSVAAGARAPKLDSGPQDVEYASIDFSLLKSKGPRDAAKKPETTETDYAEIQKQVKEEREDGGAEEGEVLEEAGIEEEEEETNHFVPEEDEGGDMEVYSNIKDLMAEM